MAFSYQTYVAGSTGLLTFNLTIGFVARENVTVTVNSVATAFTWLSDTQVQVNVVSGDTVVLRRVTPKDDETDLVVDFEDAATITEAQLDLVFRQLIFIAQEAIDEAEEAMRKNAGLTAWDAEGLPITDIGAPQVNSDAVRLIDLTNALVAAGNLPVVTVANNDSFLSVVAGVWTVVSQVAARVALGLTALATTSPGVASGQVPVLTTGGEIPAGVKGSTLDITGNPSISSLVAAQFMTGVVTLRKTGGADIQVLSKFTPSGPTDNTWVSATGAQVPFDAITRVGPFSGSNWTDGVSAVLSTYGGVSNGMLISNGSTHTAHFLAVFEANVRFRNTQGSPRAAQAFYGVFGALGADVTAIGTAGASAAGSASTIRVGDTMIRESTGESGTVLTVGSSNSITTDNVGLTGGSREAFTIVPARDANALRLAYGIVGRTSPTTCAALGSSLVPSTDFDDITEVWDTYRAVDARGLTEFQVQTHAAFSMAAGSTGDIGAVLCNLNGGSSLGTLEFDLRKDPFRLTLIRLY